MATNCGAGRPWMSLGFPAVLPFEAMTKSHYILLAALAGVSGLAAWQAMQLSELRDTNQALTTQAKTLISLAPSAAAVVPGSRNQKAKPEGEFASKADALPAPETSAAEAERIARDARFKEMRSLERTQRIDAKILALKTKLNLTPEQEADIRAAMEKGSADREALREAMDTRRRAGGATADTDKVRQEEMAKFAAAEAAQETAITAAMSEDQLAAYDAYKAEQKQTQVESRANQQLNDLQNKLSLTTEQKDAAFQFYAQQEQTGFDPGQIAAQGGDVQKAFEERQKTTLEGMQAILTPEQYELYSKQEEERSALFRSGGGFGGFGGPPRGGPPPGR